MNIKYFGEHYVFLLFVVTALKMYSCTYTLSMQDVLITLSVVYFCPLQFAYEVYKCLKMN